MEFMDNKKLLVIGLSLAILVFAGVVLSNFFGQRISLSFLRSLAEQKSQSSAESRGYIVVLPAEPLTLRGGAEQRSRIRAEHEAAKNKIKEVLGFSGRKMASTLLAEWEGVLNGLALNITTEQVERLKNLAEIKSIHPNYQVQTTLADSVPLIRASKVWLLDSSGNSCTANPSACITGQNVKIGIIDTGIDYTHPDLGGCFGPSCKVVDGYDFFNDDPDPMDDHGHGTHVAAIAASNGISNGVLKGVAPEALLVAYKVLSAGGYGYSDDIISAIERSTDPNQDGNYSDHLPVINLSLGGYGNPDDPMSTAIDNAVNAGVVAAIAAGNSGPGTETILSPGTARKAITVGATDKSDVIASFSSRGPVIWISQEGIERALLKPDVVAPGMSICAAEFDSWLSQYRCLDDKHIAISGTSMAAPHVAGMVALLVQAHPSWSTDEIKMAVRNTSVYLGSDINTYGYGRIDALNAVFSPEPPVAAISTNGTIYRQKFAVTGTATSANFQSYSLYYQKIPGQINWSLMCTKNLPVSNGRLCPASLDIGDYYLRLEVLGNNTKSLDTTQITLKNQEITYPYDLLDPKDPREISPSWKKIEISGTTGGIGFVKYTMDWCSADGNGNIYEPSCTTTGITLTRNGNFPVRSGKLGTFTPSVVPKSAFYALRLITEYKDEGGSTTYTTSVLTFIETQMQTGWPLSLGSQSAQGLKTSSPATYIEKGAKQNVLWVTKDGKKFTPLGASSKGASPNTSGFTLSFMRQPTLADIDGDGKNDIVMAYGADIAVYRHDGTFVPGWPKTISTSCGYQGQMQQGPAVADLNSDGNKEIIVGDNCGYLHVLDRNGNYLSGWPKPIGSTLNTPSVSDINGDGVKDIIIGDWMSKVYVYEPDGTLLPGWPQTLNYGPETYYFNMIFNGTSIGDLDRDGKEEIAVVGMACLKPEGCAPIEGERVDKLWIFRSDGSIFLGPISYPVGVLGGPILADVDLDGFLDIIMNSYNGDINVIDRFGNPVKGWPVKWSNAYAAVAVTVGDLDLDGKVEIASVISDSSISDVCLYVYRTDATVMSGWPVCGSATGIFFNFWGSNMTFANLDNDPEQEIAVVSSSYIGSVSLYGFYALNHNGSVVENFAKVMDDSILGDTMPIGDLDNDGDNELFAYSWSGLLYIWDLSGKGGADPWPVYQHEERHSGNLNNLIKPAPTPASGPKRR